MNARIGARTPSYWRSDLAEFTGERLIPGEVDIDLLNEHLARYTSRRGWRAASACWMRAAARATDPRNWPMRPQASRASMSRRRRSDFARAHYALPQSAFEQASCTALPHPDASFDLVVAFEVIEHLENWRDFLRGSAARAGAQRASSSSPRPTGCTTRNRAGAEGANPFHVHEFDFEEFRARAEGRSSRTFRCSWRTTSAGVTFQPHEPGNTVEVRVDAGEPAPGRDRTSSWPSARTGRRSATRRSSMCRARPTCCASANATSRCSKDELATKDEWLDKAHWRESTQAPDASCSASRRKNWSRATAGRKS